MPARQTFHRGVRDLKFATWGPAENQYGTAVDVHGVRTANLSWVVESDELRGDDVVLARYTKVIAAGLSFAQAAVDIEIVNMILGGVMTSNTQYSDVMVSEASNVPYLAIAGRVVGSGGVGDFHFFMPKAMLSGNLALNAAVDTWLIPSGDFQGVNEGVLNGILRLRKFDVPTTLSIPLATTGGGG